MSIVDGLLRIGGIIQMEFFGLDKLNIKNSDWKMGWHFPVRKIQGKSHQILENSEKILFVAFREI